jgi:glyoxylase-like metal-dependent hydrolase (beta-lactamase superfamily II)
VTAIRYGTIEDFPLAGLLPDAPRLETIDIALAVWMIRNDERTVLFDSGFFREQWFERFQITGFTRPDDAVRLAGVEPEEVTDIVISHAHWDHMGGIELFPEATIWIQEDEYAYYVGTAWQRDGRSGGIDPEDIRHLVDRNLGGQVRLVRGDDVEIMPRLVVRTGARHTFASQYLVVQGTPTVVLASDNAYLYTNLDERRAGSTFTPDDREANLEAIDTMLGIAGGLEHVVPGHDAEQFERFQQRTEGVAVIKPGRR